MFIRKYWIPLTVFLLAIVGICLYMLTTRTPKAPITIIKPVEVEKPTAEVPAPKPPPPGASPNGHWHGDEWHPGPHEPETVDSPLVAEPFVPTVPPFSNFSTDPNEDPVTAAKKRLDYIANNLHEWGHFSPRAEELIAEMTPMPEPPKVEGDEVRVIAWLDELSALRDPRSAEILIKYQMESGVMGAPVDDALVAMGPGAVPALVARLDDLSGDSYLITPMDLLTKIVEKHRSELGGIVEHIIIPKLEAIAGSTTTYQYAAERRLRLLNK